MPGLAVEPDVHPVFDVDSPLLSSRLVVLRALLVVLRALLLWRDRARCDCRCCVCSDCDCGCGTRCDWGCCARRDRGCCARCDCGCGARRDCGCGARCDCGCGTRCDCDRVGSCSRALLSICSWVSGTPSVASHLLSRLVGLRLLLRLYHRLTSPRQRNLGECRLTLVLGLMLGLLHPKRKAPLDLRRFYFFPGLR